VLDLPTPEGWKAKLTYTLRIGPLNTRRNLSVNRVLTDSTLPLTEYT